MNALSATSPGISHGRLTIHSAPRALCSHIDWSISEILGFPWRGEWALQPLVAGSYRLDIAWQGKIGTAAKLASALAGWEFLRFEISQAVHASCEGQLFRFTPDLKLHSATMNEVGEVILNENLVLSTISQCQEPALLSEKLQSLLGIPWERELEPFRIALSENDHHFKDKMTV